MFVTAIKGADTYRLSKVINKSKNYKEIFERELHFRDMQKLDLLITEEVAKKEKRKVKAKKSN